MLALSKHMRFSARTLALLLPAISWAAPTPQTHSWLGFEQRGDSFVARGTSYSLQVDPMGAVLRLPGSSVTLQTLHSQGAWALTGLEQRPGLVHYFKRPGPCEYLPFVSRVKAAAGVYPGVDLIFRGNDQRFEYDFEITPGRDPATIALGFQGATGLKIGKDGDLLLTTPDGEILQPKPVAWQFVNGEKHLVDVSYRISKDGSVSFLLGTYAPNLALTIDPAIVFQNDIGGSKLGSGTAIALDSLGNIFVAGQTDALDFPQVNPLPLPAGAHSTSFVQKWSPDGSTLIYSTYFGDSADISALAVDAAGSAYVAGTTGSPGFPVTPNAFQKQLAGLRNGFVSKLAPDGSQLVYSTYLGGGTEYVSALAVDTSGNAIVTGETSSAGFPLTPGAYQTSISTSCNLSLLVAIGVPPNGDAFVTRLAADGSSLSYSTLLGGVCGTIGQSLALDSAGNVWVAGKTSSKDFPVTGNALQLKSGEAIVDGFLAQFTLQGALTYSSYLGAKYYGSISGIARDSQGNLFISGVTSGLSQPASQNAVQSGTALSCVALGTGPVNIYDNGVAFIAKLDPLATSIRGLTYLGGGCVLNASVAVDADGNPWVAGNLRSQHTFYPTVSPFEIWADGSFLSKLNPDLTQLPFSTFFPQINAMTLDSKGFAYVTGAAAVTKIDPTPAPVSLDSVSPVGIAPGNENGNLIAAGQVVRLFGKNLGPVTQVPGIVAGGSVLSQVAGVRVSFDGYAAPVLLAGAEEIETVVPFEVAGQKSTTIQVTNNGVPSNAVKVALEPGALEILGVFNEDFGINSAANPAAAGSVMSIYVSGVGSLTPDAVDGKVNQPPYSDLSQRFQLIGCIPGVNDCPILTVTAANPATGAVAGVIQVNFVIPAGVNRVNIRADNGGFTEFSPAVH